MITKLPNKINEKSIRYEDYYPDDFESYSSEEEESNHDSHEDSLELIVINPKNTTQIQILPTNLDDLHSKIDLEFEYELDFLLKKQADTKKNKDPAKMNHSLNFHTPLFSRRATKNIDEWIEKQSQDLKLSSESQRTIPYSYAKNNRRDREESPSTEFSYNPNKKFNCNNPRPTLCDKPIMFSKTVQPPNITACCWGILNGESNQVICGKNLNKKREMASLTKIMTAVVVCQLVERMKLCPQTTYLQISKKSSTYQGTSANLLEGDILSVWDLLHGLMLPSGNDAASCLSENFGIYLYYETFERKTGSNNTIALPKKGCLNYFIDEMNECAKKLKLKHTIYSNAHGLPNDLNKSTVFDLCKLSSFAMKNEMMSEIVQKKYYKVFIKNKFGKSREMDWINLNRMLEVEGFIGLKTGVTAPAGACLSSVYKTEKLHLIFVVLGCESKDERFDDTERLLNWIKCKISPSFLKF